MKKNKENLAQKYFSQKSDLWLDVLAISLVVLGIFIYIFGFKISFIGIPMVFAGVIFKAVDLFVYIKDKEFDDHINYLKETNIVIYPEEKPDFIMELFDVEKAPVKIGRDQKARSSVYSFSKFKTVDNVCTIEVYSINALENNVTHEVYTPSLRSKCEIVEERNSNINRIVSYLVISGDFNLRIPVKNSSYDLEEFVKNFKA